ncbi:MAG: hypothetical protein ABIF82_11045 [Planctomycetota bacterium]
MAGSSGARSDFKFILNNVRSDAVDAVAHELTQLFPLDAPTALNITKNAPIILLDNLTPQQGRNVGTYAIRLKALGADVQVTGQPVGKLQVLRWPLLPDIAKRAGNHLICPNCGARLQVQVFVPPVGPQPAKEAPEQPAAEPSAEPAPTPEAQPEAAPDAAPGAEEDVLDEVILEPIDDEPAEEVEIVGLEPEAEFAVPEPGPAIEVASDVPAGIGGDGSCRVTIVGKIKGKKKLGAAELMTQYLGIDQDEALSRLNKRTVVTVAADLSPTQAERCGKDFADIGVKVTIKG